MKLWPKAKVRPIRFHDLRHTTASLLMMAGANPASVHLRHSNVKTTTTVYGHLLPDYLRSEIDRLTFYSGVSKSGHADSSALLPVAPDAKKFGAHLLPGSESGPPGLPPGGGISEEFHNVGLAGWTGLE
ncbi:MAG: hypothetical protein ABSF35_20135 [Polyangia bacterium]|jgi:hypothetical protein